MKYKLAAFMQGRNGVDELSKVILWGSVIVMLLSRFLPVDWLASLIYWVTLAGVIYSYYRIFSKKLDQCHAENQAFLTWKNQMKQRWTQRKTHKFYHCPKCRTVLRVPKGKGKLNITCRCCGERFIRKT